MITTFAFEGNVVIQKHYFLQIVINIIFYRTKNYIYNLDISIFVKLVANNLYFLMYLGIH